MRGRSRAMTDFLYPVHRGRRARRRRRCSPTWPARPRRKARESAALAGRHARPRRRRRSPAPAAAMAERFAAGGRLFTFGNGGSATDAAGVAALFAQPAVRAGRCPARSPGRRPGGAHRPRQRRRLRPRLLPPAHRPRPAGRHRPRALDQRQLREPARGLRRSPPAGPAHHRPRRLRRRADGGVGRRRPLHRRAVRQRPPHPGDPGGRRGRPVGGRSSGRSTADGVRPA